MSDDEQPATGPDGRPDGGHEAELLKAANHTTDAAQLMIDNALTQAEARARNLEAALATSRLIGMALGIIIERCRLSPDDAFALLRTISQRENRKVSELASDLVHTGVIPEAA